MDTLRRLESVFDKQAKTALKINCRGQELPSFPSVAASEKYVCCQSQGGGGFAPQFSSGSKTLPEASDISWFQFGDSFLRGSSKRNKTQNTSEDKNVILASKKANKKSKLCQNHVYTFSLKTYET